MQMLQIDWRGQTLTLLPQKAIHWREEETLIITDPHFGKDATFRSAGIPIPSGGTAADLKRLSGMLTEFTPRRLLILGDFFHTAQSRSEDVLSALLNWRAEFPDIEITLIPGNHDKHSGRPPQEMNLVMADGGCTIGPFDFLHIPQVRERYTFAGHIHPAVMLRDSSGATLKAPCFCFGKDVALLPAFGSFTGTAHIKPCAGERVFLVGPDQVVEVPPSATTA
ncbi:ligase-associated DNA damage response endonuclease PdeM [soil metagenome]